MGFTYTHAHAAACVATLPLGSRLLAAIHGAQCAWTITDYRLHYLACVVAGQELPYPWDAKRTSNAGLPEFEPLPLDEISKWRASKISG